VIHPLIVPRIRHKLVQLLYRAAVQNFAMDDTLYMRRPDGGPDTVIDMAVFEQILNVGDAGLREALIEQLLTDFRRISKALTEGGWDEVGAAAHELKGLAATIGAHRLAELAKRLNSVADCAIASEPGEFRAPVEGEIRIVLDNLARHAGRARP
jgi:hypothetical protein